MAICRGTDLTFEELSLRGTPKDAVPDMATQCAAQFEPFAWSLTREAIGQALRKPYAVTTELPPELLALVRKLAAARDERQFCTPVRILDALEGNYLLRYVSPVEPRSVGPSDTDWPLCT